MTDFGYKTDSMVVKSIGFFTQRTSPTYWRTEGVMETRAGQPFVSASHSADSVANIVDLYKQVT